MMEKKGGGMEVEVHPIGIYLIGVHLTSVHLTGVYLQTCIS